MPNFTRELAYLLLIVALIVVPRLLQRFRLPAPLTSFAIGMAASLWLGAFSQDATLSLLATLGISSLFLFAGLEIDLQELSKGKWLLLGHLAMRSLTTFALGYAAYSVFEFSWQISVLLSLALLTPSTGFILDTLPLLGLNDTERLWVKMKAVAGELLALMVLFVVLQADTLPQLALSSLALVAMLVVLPLLFVVLGRHVVPHAPGSEFSMLVAVGLVAAYMTYKLGVYYLVGAFLAGFVARLLRQRMPSLASEENLHAIKMFASFFVPFYFFYKGLGLPEGALGWSSLGLGLALAAGMLPLRAGVVWTQQRFVAGQTAAGSLRVATALLPTLIFTLVLASILRDRFGISATLYGALLVYAAVSTLVPSILLVRPMSFDPLAPPKPHPDAPSGPPP